MITKATKIKILLVVAALVIGCFLFLIIENKNIQTTKSDFVNAKIPEAFNGFKICQISDLHNTCFGKNQKILLEKIKAADPDIIVVTGDLIDRRRYDLDTAMAFVNGALRIAPIYYVSGNHEAWSGKYEDIKKELVKAGVTVLNDESASVMVNNSRIDILCLSGPDFLTSNGSQKTDTTKMTTQLTAWSQEPGFKILLTHRPELFELYAKNNMDLIFAGHAHGGQLRLPFIGGLFAPDQGLFPKYTSGSHTKSASTIYVSRGLGNSLFPLRIFNRPEIVIVTLHTS